jgi:hypothetical protein
VQHIPLTDSQVSFNLPAASDVELEAGHALGAAKPAPGRCSVKYAVGGLQRIPQGCHLGTVAAAPHSPTAGGCTAAAGACALRDELAVLHV